MNPRISAVATALPPHLVEQEVALAAARALFTDMADDDFERLAGVFERVGVARRHVCAPLDWFAGEHPFHERNELYVHWAMDLGAQAARKALAAAGVDPVDVGSIVFVSTTGLATPSLDARLAAELGLAARHVHREAMFGRGCSGGVVGLAQTADRVRLDPDRPALLVVVELCSLAYRGRGAVAADVVSAALFGDGAAACVLAADGRSGVEVLGHDGITWPGTERLMGWDFGDEGMAVVLSPRIPMLVRREFRGSVEAACDRFGVAAGDVSHHLVHPGSALILDEVERGLGLEADALALSRAVLRDGGNMSAATVLFILERFLGAGHGDDGDGLALMSAMGPGFSADHLLLRW